MWDTGTVIVGIIIKITFRYKIEYIVEKNIKNQGAKYRSLRNTFKQFRPLTPCVSQLNPLFAATQVTLLMYKLL